MSKSQCIDPDIISPFNKPSTPSTSVPSQPFFPKVTRRERIQRYPRRRERESSAKATLHSSTWFLRHPLCRKEKRKEKPFKQKLLLALLSFHCHQTSQFPVENIKPSPIHPRLAPDTRIDLIPPPCSRSGQLAMAAVDNQQTWVPYEPIRDCTQGLCTIYCPQWCYLIFPPPPPLELSDDSSGPTFSPLVIAIIGILASAFLLVSYYTIISKYCGAFNSLRRRLQGPGVHDHELEDGLAQSHRHEAWHLSPSNGLDEALIDNIAVCKYRRGDGLVDGTDCSVCLSEFREDDSLRLLPKCNHAFHVQCIDTWLKSHSNCPLCRADIVSVGSSSPPSPLPAPPEPENTSPAAEGERSFEETAVAIEGLEGGRGQEVIQPRNDGDLPPKDHPSQILRDLERMEESDTIIEIGDDAVQPIRRSFSMDCSHRGRVSIADVLQTSMEAELVAAKDHGFLVGIGSSTRWGGEHCRNRGSRCVVSPVPMKRSFSSERLCFTRHGKGSSSVLPV